ncbi:MAG: tyrosine-type recombinase/integrase [Planctomycetales bacterium]|nr:tyrosine-type recombinase/integrase [Planctomycetales bacterium]
MQEERALIPQGEVPEIASGNVPRQVEEAGAAASFAWEEFFIGKIRNPHTRHAYLTAVRRFLAWLEPQGIPLAKITPGMVGQYFDSLSLSIPSKKLHLAGIRAFFDTLVVRHVMVLNPALSVRTERYSAIEGKTPEITVEQARKLLASIPLKSLIDLRDRAIIGVLIYTAARAGAVAKLKMRDLMPDGGLMVLRFAEKGGKARTIPVRHDLQSALQDYLFATGVESDTKDSPLFRSHRLTGLPSAQAIKAGDICRMVKRRLKAAGLSTLISPHSFRSCAATDLLVQGVPLEDVQYLLGHSVSRTTQLYDRRRRQVTRNIVERISV